MTFLSWQTDFFVAHFIISNGPVYYRRSPTRLQLCRPITRIFKFELCFVSSNHSTIDLKFFNLVGIHLPMRAAISKFFMKLAVSKISTASFQMRACCEIVSWDSQERLMNPNWNTAIVRQSSSSVHRSFRLVNPGFSIHFVRLSFSTVYLLHRISLC